MTLTTVLLDVYGIGVEINGRDGNTVDHLAEDFAHFRTGTLAAAPAVTLSLHDEAPPYADIPARPATVYTPRNISFHDGDVTYIDYSGRALGMLHTTSGHLDVYSMSADLLYEVGYLFLLSQLGERLDREHLHRVHGAAISVDGKAALVLLPMGGGKSTLCMHVLADPRVQFLSDDSPILDREGNLHAFPLRIGILPGSEEGYGPEHLRTIQRMEFGPKLLLKHEFFEDRIVDSAPCDFLFLGRRTLSETCEIVPASRIAALRALIPNCVIGLGLFQGMEFVFNRDAGEIWRKAVVALSRLRNCIALVRKSQPYFILLGRDLDKNAATIVEFMQETKGNE